MKAIKSSVRATKLTVAILCTSIAVCSCNFTGKGAAIGAASGTAAGAGIGALIGKFTGNTKLGAAVGASAGLAVGTTAGALIGKKMDKAAAAASKIDGAQVDTYTDKNGLEGVKVTFDNGILFAVGQSTIQPTAQRALSKFAARVLNVYTDCDVNIYGFASSDGSDETNMRISRERAQAVTNYLTGSCGVQPQQIRTTMGYGENPDYLIRNADGTENLQASRRVEIYLYASQEMIEAANNGTLK